MISNWQDAEVWKKHNGAYLTIRGYNGRCVVAWLADALRRFWQHATDEGNGRLVGVWVSHAVARGDLPAWPDDALLAPTLEALNPDGMPARTRISILF